MELILHFTFSYYLSRGLIKLNVIPMFVPIPSWMYYIFIKKTKRNIIEKNLLIHSEVIINMNVGKKRRKIHNGMCKKEESRARSS